MCRVSGAEGGRERGLAVSRVEAEVLMRFSFGGSKPLKGMEKTGMSRGRRDTTPSPLCHLLSKHWLLPPVLQAANSDVR